MNRAPKNWAFALVTFLCGLLVVTAAATASETKRAQRPRRERLVELIHARQDQVDGLDEVVRSLRDDVSDARGELARTGSAERDQAALAERLGLWAGTTAVRGRGIVIALSDSQREPQGGDEQTAFRIHDVDLQLVANALFAAGAEAVAVNGNRLVATSPIRAAGDTIVVNFRPLTPPYEIVAIGANRGRFEESEIARRFERWTSQFGLGFKMREPGSVTVPAYAGRVALTHARTS